MDDAKKSWGKWVLDRAQYLGYKRQEDLAQEVGCQRQQIFKWGRMEIPPKQMRKGFDFKLAWALKTSPDMLFKEWVNTPPEKARELIFKRSEKPGPEYFKKATDRQLLEEFLNRIVAALSDQHLEELTGSALVMMVAEDSSGDFLRGFDHPFLKRMKGFFEFGSRSPESWQVIDEKDRRERPQTREEFRVFLEKLRQEDAAKSAEFPAASKPVRKPSKPPPKPQ